MFETLEEAVNFSKEKVDGGIPVFRWEAVEIPNSDPPDYENVPFVTIFNRSDPKTVIERQVFDKDKKRWPDQWKAFEEGTTAPVNGIPLSEFPALSPADIAICNKNHTRTVEELAEFPDGNIKSLGGKGYAMKAAAKKFLEYREHNVGDLLTRIAELEKKLDNGTGNATKRSTRNKPAKTKRSNKRKPGPSRKRVPDSKDDGKETSD